jgi:hypothetical protein
MSDISVTFDSTAVQVNFPVATSIDVAVWLEGLDSYESNEAAIAGGLSVGDWYKTTANHVQIPGVQPTKVQ